MRDSSRAQQQCLPGLLTRYILARDTVLIITQYWKQLAFSIGGYDAEDINAGGPKGDLIQQQIKQDYTR